MREKDLDEPDKVRLKLYKKFFSDFFKENSPKLSINSIKLYMRGCSLVAVKILPKSKKVIDHKYFLKKLTSLYNLNDIDFLEIDTTNLNNLNTIINAIGKFIQIAGEIKENSDKAIALLDHIRKRSGEIRDEIQGIKLNNVKSEQELEHMKPFEDYVRVAERLYHEYEKSLELAKEMGDFEEGVNTFLPKLKFRNTILITLILLNRTSVDEVMLYSILRLVEYSDLILWTKKEEPPKDKRNYISIPDEVIYLQHSKTTGGLTASGLQPTLKKFKIYNEKIIEMIKLYNDIYEIGNDMPLFTSSFKNGKEAPLNKTNLSKLLKVIFQDISGHTTIGLIRKSYDNRQVKLTGQQFKQSANLNDHSIEVIHTFYKKI